MVGLGIEMKLAYRRLTTAEKYGDDAAVERAWRVRWATFDRMRKTRAVSPADLRAKVAVCIAELEKYENDAAATQMLRSLHRDLAALSD